LEAVRYRASPAFEINQLALTHHMLVLFARPPVELDVRYEGVKRHVPPPAGSVLLLPAGSPARVRPGGHKDELHGLLEPGRVGPGGCARGPSARAGAGRRGRRVAAGARLRRRAAMLAVGADRAAGGAGGRLVAESLANVLAVDLLRHALAPRRPQRGRDST